jgi:hydroxyacylglutathione hydrolase
MRLIRSVWLASISMQILLTSCASSYDVNRMHPFEVSTFRKSYSNTHVIKIAEQKYLMIDAGADSDAESLDVDMRAHGINPEWVALLVLTHGHWDHAGGARYFQDRYKIPVVIGAGDQELLSKGHSDALCPTDFMARWRVSSDTERRFLPPKPDVVLTQNTPLDPWFGAGVGEMWVVPAHTPGSVVVRVGQGLFVGDLFRGAMLSQAAVTHFYMCDVAMAKRLTSDLLMTKAPGATLVFPGHFGPVVRRGNVLNWATAQ